MTWANAAALTPGDAPVPHIPRHADHASVWHDSGMQHKPWIEALESALRVVEGDVLVAVADDLQNSVMHVLWGTVWPVCPTHDLGAHTREHDGVAVWWCNSLGGHVIAPMGQPVAATVCRYTGSVRNGSRTARAIAYEVSAACALTCPSPGQRRRACS